MNEGTELDFVADGKLHLSEREAALFVEQVLIMATKITDAAGRRVYVRFDPINAQNMAFIMLRRLTIDAGGNGLRPGSHDLVIGDECA